MRGHNAQSFASIPKQSQDVSVCQLLKNIQMANLLHQIVKKRMGAIGIFRVVSTVRYLKWQN